MRISASFTAFQPFTRVGYTVDGYNRDGAEISPNPTGRPWDGELWENAAWIDNFPQFGIINDGYLSYLANTAYTRRYSYESAGWSKDKSLAGTNTTVDIANRQRSTDAGSNAIQNQAIESNRIIGAVSSLAGGAMSGTPMGFAGGVLSAGASVAQSMVNQGAMNQQFALTQEMAMYTTDANSTLARFAAQGDYENAINAIDSQVEQAQLSAPSTSGMMGGNGFAFANGLMGLRYKIKVPNKASLRIIGDYFLRFGYAIHRILMLPDNLLCMTNYAYWKCKEVNLIECGGNESAKNTIRGILEQGTTIWRTPEVIGWTEPIDNLPASGFRY
jgi:hypothetical protein